MTTLFHRLQPAQKFRITAGAIARSAPAKLIAQLLKIPKHLIVRVVCVAWCEAAYAGHISSLSIALMKADNSSVTVVYNIGSMRSPARFKTAQPANNYGNCD